MNLILTWKKLAIGHVNGKCNLTTLPTNKQMKLISLENQTHTVYSIYLLNSVRIILLNEQTSMSKIRLETKLIK